MSVNLERGKFYFLRVLISGRELEYNCKVLSVSGEKVKIFSEGGDCLDFRLKDIVYFRKIESFEGEIVIGVGKRVSKSKLRVEKGPFG